MGFQKKRYKQYKKTTWVAEFFKKNQFVIYGINVIDPESTASVASQQKSTVFFRCSRTIEIGVSEVKTYMKVIDCWTPTPAWSILAR